MIPPPVLVAERVRQRLRSEGTDPTSDPAAARAIALAEVRRFNAVSYTHLTLPTIYSV